MPTDPLPPWVLARRREIGVRVRDLRESRGLTIDQLADRAGIDRKTVIRTELARHAVSIDYLMVIAKALDVPLSHVVRE